MAQRSGSTRSNTPSLSGLRIATGALVFLQFLVSVPFASQARAAAGITTQVTGASFNPAPTEGAMSLVTSFSLANSSDNHYAWENAGFNFDGYCVNTYGQTKIVESAGTGSAPFGFSWNTNSACGAGYYAGSYRVYMASSGQTLLQWDSGMPVTDPPPAPDVDVQVPGARFSVLPVVGSSRMEGTYVLDNSTDNHYDWEYKTWAVDVWCALPDGTGLSQLGGSTSGAFVNGTTQNFDWACPAGKTAWHFKMYSDHLDSNRNTVIDKVLLEWTAGTGGTAAEQTYGDGVHSIDPSGRAGDPVNTATGAYQTSVTDLALPGLGYPFKLTRYYTSADLTSGSLGQGWTYSLAPSLTIKTNGDVILRGEDGQQIFYQKQANGSFVGAAGSTSTLTAVTGGYDLLRQDQVKYSFNSSGRLTKIVDRNNLGVTPAYDGSGKLTSVTDAAGRVINFTYNGSGLLSGASLPDGRSVSYGYTSGRLTSVTDVRGNTTTYTYDPYGRLAEVFDQNNHRVIKNVYGGAGRVTQQTDALGNVTTFDWNATTQTATITDARNNVWKDIYSRNVLIERDDPLGDTTKFTYDPTLNLTKVIDARGNATTMTYDGRHNLLTRTGPAPSSVQQTYTYDSKNDVTSYTNGRGNATSYGYDSAGNLTSITRPGTAVTQLGRDSNGTGELVSLTDSRSKTWTFTYDSAGNRTSETSPLGEKTTWGYDQSGRITSRIEARGNDNGATPSQYQWTYSYDAANHLHTRTDPLGNATTWAYDPAGNLSSLTDANSHTTSYAYNAGNELTSATAPDTTVTSYGYNATGDLTSRIDANNHTTTYSYDAARRLTDVNAPLSQHWSYTYDANGNRKTVVDPNGNATTDTTDGTTTFSYDELNRLTGISYSDSTPAVSFGYNADSLRTSMTDGSGSVSYTYNSRDRLTGVTRGLDSFSYGYDSVGDVTSRTYPDGSSATYSYDDDARLSSVTSSNQTTTYGYDSAGHVTSVTLPSGNGYHATRTFDRAGRLTEVTNANSSSTLSDYVYTRDAVGNPTQVVSQDGTTSLTYDALDRLKKVCYATSCPNSTDPFVEYTYDSVGNRTAESGPKALGGAGGAATYSYNAADELTGKVVGTDTTSYTYDTDGQQTQAGDRSFTYDLAGNLASTTKGNDSTVYSYDGDGTRIKAVNSTNGSGTSSSDLLWDVNFGLPQLAEERDSSSGSVARSYLYGLSRIAMKTGGNAYYYHYDGQGSVVGLTSGTGTTEWTYSYEPFGGQLSAQKVDSQAPDNPMRYQGEYLDGASGLYYLRARSYDAAMGRFPSIDPLVPSKWRPHSSSYIYVVDRPTVEEDPSGLTDINDGGGGGYLPSDFGAAEGSGASEETLGGGELGGEPAVTGTTCESTAAVDGQIAEGRGLDDILNDPDTFNRYIKSSFNPNDPISPSDAQKIWDKMKDLGYEPRLDEGHARGIWSGPHINVPGTSIHIPVSDGFHP